jgi:hypothetical protein
MKLGDKDAIKSTYLPNKIYLTLLYTVPFGITDLLMVKLAKC